jgi:hypothetical protein
MAVPFVVIFASLHIYIGFSLLFYALMARLMGRMLSSWALLYWALVVELFWVGAVLKSGPPVLQLLRVWNPQFKILCAVAVGVAAHELLSNHHKAVRLIFSPAIGFGVCLGLVPYVFTGWVVAQGAYQVDLRDGVVRDPVFASEVVARFGWLIYSVAVLMIVCVVLVALLKWPGLFLSFMLLGLSAFLLVVLQADNIIDIVAAWLREGLGWSFSLPEIGSFSINDLVDLPNWPTGNFELPATPAVEYPDWVPDWARMGVSA